MPFDPFKDGGATELTEWNPFDDGGAAPLGDTQGYLADKARRFGREVPKQIGDVVASPGSALQSATELVAEAMRWRAMRSGDLTEAEAAAKKQEFLDRAGQTAPMQAAQAIRDVGAELGQVGTRHIAQPDPARDAEIGSAVATGAASLAPLLAAGAVAPIAAIPAAAGMMGEQQRQDAAEKGATPTQQAASFMVGAPVGAASEALLGVPALLGSVRGAKAVPDMLGKAAGGLDTMMAGLFAKMAPSIVPVAQQAVKSAVREGVQEGLEQIAQNTIAKDVVGYDPTRDRTEGAGMAMLAGGIVGGGIGAGHQAAHELGKPTPAAPLTREPAATDKPSATGSTTTPDAGDQAPAPTSPNFVSDLLAQDATKAAADREARAKEESARTERQKELDEKKTRFDERLAVARETLADPAAPFERVKGALESISSYADDNALGLTQTQREQALAAQAALAQRHEQLKPAAEAAADAAAESRRTEAKLAADAKQEKVRREQAALQHLETTGRDLATGDITDLRYVPDEELAVLNPEAEGLTAQQLDAEIQRRGEAAERAAATGSDAGYTLRDLILGKRAALAAAGQRTPLRLKSPAALSLEGGTMAGEHRAIGERQGGFRIFADNGLAEDTLQERLQELGFNAPDVTTAYALYERALGGEEIRPERTGENQVEFAQAPQTDSPEFKTWFGNSKITDKEGRPLIVYHGTDTRFTTFEQTSDIGYHFGTRAAARTMGRHLMPAFLRIENPIRLPDLGTWGLFDVMRNIPRSILTSKEVDEIGTIHQTGYAGQSDELLIAKLRAKGYDGFTYENAIEDKGTMSYIAFEPTQIKSATTNRGTFDPADPRIDHATTPTTEPAPRATLTDAEVDQRLEQIRREFPALTRDVDIRSGLVADELKNAGYEGKVPAGVQAAIYHLDAEKRLLVIAARAMQAGQGSGLFLHEMAHPFYDALPVETKTVLRELHAREMAEKTGPLFDSAGQLKTDLYVRAEDFSADRLAKDPDLPVKEWFAERVRALNATWLDGRLPRDHSTLVRVWHDFLAKLREIFAKVRGLNPDSDLFTDAFRRWLDTGARADTTRTGLAYAERHRAEFAEGSPGADPELPQYPREANTQKGPLKESRQIAGKWRDIMPSFQGWKRDMATYAAEKIRSALTPEQRESITTVQDWFGGGGSWGLHLALTHFPNARNLHVHEFLPDRLEKIRIFHAEGAAIKADLTALTPQITTANERMVADGKPSPAAFISRLKSIVGENADARTRAILTALEDRADNDFASATDEEGNRSAALSIQDLINNVVGDAGRAKRGADAFRARGGEIQYSSGDSYAQPIEPGPTTFSVFDPPYYKTAGYSGADSIGGKVPISIYRKTAARINELAAAGHGILYTDSAWWIDERKKAERTNAQQTDVSLDLGDTTSVAPDPEGRSRLSYILDSIDSANIVPIAARHEILGINAPGSSSRAKSSQEPNRTRGDSRNNTSEPRDQRSGTGATGELAMEPTQPAPAEAVSRSEGRADAGTGTDAEVGAADPRQRLADVEQRLADLNNSQEDPADIEARGKALAAERDQIKQEIASEERDAATAAAVRPASELSPDESGRVMRHPLAVAEPEPGDAWAMTPKMTDQELAQERERITTHTHDNFAGLAPAEHADLRARVDAIKAEQIRRGPPAGVTVTPIPKIDRQAALRAELQRGRELRDQGDQTGNAAATAEGVRLVRLATDTLDAEYPGWDKQPAKSDGSKTPPPPPPPTAEAAQPGDGEQSPFSGAEEETMPERTGKFNEVYGHDTYQPSFLLRSWRKIRDAITGIKGPIPELPTFPAAAWNKLDTFIREHGPQFYARVAEGERSLKGGNDYIQRTAEEQVGRIIKPLLTAGDKFNADDYAQLRRRQEQARRLQADGKPVPPGVAAEIAALNSKMETSPYVLFNRLVLALDLNWRQQNLKDSAGNPIRLPAGVNARETAAEVQRLGARIAASPHAALIKTAIEQHMALVKDTASELKSRELLAPDHLANPYYFPHITLETTRGGKTEQRELRPSRVRPGTEADFRGYLVDPVGSTKAISTDYVRSMYYHLVQVGAHNFKADAVRDYFRPYDIKTTVETRAKELTKQRGRPVSWEQAFHEEFAPRGYVLYGTDSRDAFPTVTVNRDALARRLGVMLTSADIHQQLKELGHKDVKLLPEDLRETLAMGARETWILPARVAEALRGIADRASKQDNAIEAAAKFTLGIWKGYKLFMPWNHIRYEFGNIVADTEKILSSSPGTFKQLPAAAKELRAFWTGGEPSADLRAALKEGVINAITAQELDGLVRQKAFEALQTRGEKAWDFIKRRGSSVAYQPATQLLGLGDFSSPELSALREAVTRYAKFKNDLAAIRAGARPDYAGAYWRNIEAMTESRPGAGDADVRKAAAISKATFGDYGDLSVGGQALRDRLVPFYSWMEINFRYHANLLRNLRDMVRSGEIGATQATGQAARTAAVATAGLAARTAGGIALRLALPYMAVALWNNSGDRDELEKLLSEEDRRRFHIIVGRDKEGRVQVLYGQTALNDVLKWFSGQKFAQAMGQWFNGKTDFQTAVGTWKDAILPDLANNTVGSVGPAFKIPYALMAKKSTFPDVTDQKTIPAYDMRRNIIGQMTDDFTADAIERTVNKDYYGAKEVGDWAKQLIMQVRQRDPESWAFYAIKDKANDYLEKRTGTKRDSAMDAPDQQVLRNFRRAIYRGDVDKAVQFYQRLLDYGYTAERFHQSIQSQDPLSALPKENGLRQQFVAGLEPDDRAMLDRAYAYYQRMSSSKGRERQLFPPKASGLNGQMRYQAQPRTDQLRAMMERTEGMSEDEIRARGLRDERRSLQRTR